jgi:hypothetical protein
MKVALAFLLVLTTSAMAGGRKTDLHCVTGPVQKTYGGTRWIVHSCTDGRSLVFTAASGPAAPFEFDLTYTGNGYDLDGHGKGDRKATDAAYADLQKLHAKDILGLLKETQHAERKR